MSSVASLESLEPVLVTKDDSTPVLAEVGLSELESLLLLRGQSRSEWASVRA